MLGGEIVITRDDLKNLSYAESATLNKLIRDDFIAYYDEMKDFDLSKLLEYRLSHRLKNPCGSGLLSSEKDNATLKFSDTENNKTYSLRIDFQYAG